MAVCALSAFALGYGLGHRFRIFVLLPVEILALMVAAVMAGFMGLSGTTACLGFAACSIALQAGYGLALASPLPVRRFVRLPTTHLS